MGGEKGGNEELLQGTQATRLTDGLIKDTFLGPKWSFLSESARSGSFSWAVGLGAYLTCGCSCSKLSASPLAFGFLRYSNSPVSLDLPNRTGSFHRPFFLSWAVGCFIALPESYTTSRSGDLWISAPKAGPSSELFQWSSGCRYLESQRNFAEPQNIHMLRNICK